MAPELLVLDVEVPDPVGFAEHAATGPAPMAAQTTTKGMVLMGKRSAPAPVQDPYATH
jgi:hypothetical protein